MILFTIAPPAIGFESLRLNVDIAISREPRPKCTRGSQLLSRPVALRPVQAVKAAVVVVTVGVVLAIRDGSGRRNAAQKEDRLGGEAKPKHAAAAMVTSLFEVVVPAPLVAPVAAVFVVVVVVVVVVVTDFAVVVALLVGGIGVGCVGVPVFDSAGAAAAATAAASAAAAAAAAAVSTAVGCGAGGCCRDGVDGAAVGVAVLLKLALTMWVLACLALVLVLTMALIFRLVLTAVLLVLIASTGLALTLMVVVLVLMALVVGDDWRPPRGRPMHDRERQSMISLVAMTRNSFRTRKRT